ncbi:MAG: lytic murein transglycosylase B [Gammaproteobacteria bacterium]|nr:lytic murein transglycosylase B [Gammaproteobacteria bacterium]
MRREGSYPDSPMKLNLVPVFLALLFNCDSTLAIDVDRPVVQDFIDGMVSTHDYDRETLVAMLEDAKSRESIIEAISRPAEKTLEWHEYRAIFLTEKRIDAGVAFWDEHQGELERISRGTGVPCEMLVSIIGVETFFGRITGGYRVIDALTTLAFDYPPRSKFFRRELEQFFLLVREEGMDARDATGSYAGAMGAPQFMPSSYRAYAVDSSDDGRRDIWSNWSDVIGSVANYFVEHDWQPGDPVVARATLPAEWKHAPPTNILRPADSVMSLSRKGVMFSTSLPADHPTQLLTLNGDNGTEHWVGFHNFFVITRYNRSVMYALAVHQLGQEIALARTMAAADKR